MVQNYGLYEVAVLKKITDDNYVLCYDTPITDDVIGYLNNEQVIEILEQIKNLNNKIAKLTYKGKLIKFGTTEEFTDDIDDYCTAINSILDSIGIKINEIIDKLNREGK
jgi:hypothetical protein